MGIEEFRTLGSSVTDSYICILFSPISHFVHVSIVGVSFSIVDETNEELKMCFSFGRPAQAHLTSKLASGGTGVLLNTDEDAIDSGGCGKETLELL